MANRARTVDQTSGNLGTPNVHANDQVFRSGAFKHSLPLAPVACFHTVTNAGTSCLCSASSSE